VLQQNHDKRFPKITGFEYKTVSRGKEDQTILPRTADTFCCAEKPSYAPDHISLVCNHSNAPKIFNLDDHVNRKTSRQVSTALHTLHEPYCFAAISPREKNILLKIQTPRASTVFWTSLVHLTNRASAMNHLLLVVVWLMTTRHDMRYNNTELLRRYRLLSRDHVGDKAPSATLSYGHQQTSSDWSPPLCNVSAASGTVSNRGVQTAALLCKQHC